MLAYNQGTPVLLLIFNRPDTTKLVFESIRNTQPRKLYISADGPRNENEKQLCELTRAVVSNVDWPCEVKTLFSDENKGCKLAISEGITWFFENEEEGIILEDDCLPSQSFFGFCSMLLEKYRYDDRIGHIGGSNLQLGIERGDASYYFSRLTHVWGWAGWRRVWKDYDVEMKTFPVFQEMNGIEKIASHAPFENLWNNAFQETFLKNIDTWDYQYAYLNLVNNRLSLIPNVNLISNLGFGNQATHTFNENNVYANLAIGSMSAISHPLFFIADKEADIFTQIQEAQSLNSHKKKGLLSKFWRSIKSAFKRKQD